MARNPAWARDELILALELYFEAGQLGPRDQRVMELSELLNGLGIHPEPPDAAHFRNVNGVCLKLANFRALDPLDPAEGMPRGGRGDREVFDEFTDDRLRLRRVAHAIREAALGRDVYPIPEEDEDSVSEGRLLYRRHRQRERNRGLVSRKQKAVLKDTGRLACEVCGFEFGDAYGEHGSDYIEVHHRRPLAESGPTRTRLTDLAVVCANCHRMLHRGKPWPSVQQLRVLYEAQQG
jgi:5-methylcytosine-specific restriction enzyme A